MEATIERKRKKASKSRHVREAITLLGKDASAQAVCEHLLRTKKIKASPALVYQMRHKMQNGSAPPSAETQPVLVDLGALLRAKKAIKQIGTLEEAKQAILLLDQLKF